MMVDTSLLETARREAQKAAAGLRVRSVLNPALWAMGVGSPVFLVAAWGFRGSPLTCAALIVTAILLVLLVIFGYLFFAISMPKMLQSEEYQLRSEALQIIQVRQEVSSTDAKTFASVVRDAIRASATTKELE